MSSALVRTLQLKKELSSLMAELTAFFVRYPAARFERVWITDDALQLACYIITAENPEAAAAQRYSDYLAATAAENPMPDRKTAPYEMDMSNIDVLNQRVREFTAFTTLTMMQQM